MLLNETPRNIDEELKEFDSLVDLIHDAIDEEIPPFEPDGKKQVAYTQLQEKQGRL